LSRDSRLDPPILVSACLLGVECRYDGGTTPRPLPQRLAAEGQVLPICPEQLGGLSTPRLPAEIQGGDGADVLEGRARVLDSAGADVSRQYLEGARMSLHLARLAGCRKAILKERSPSCGVAALRAGGSLVTGMGVTAALLALEGVEVISDEDPALGERLHED